jgi:hypothetical protein
MEPQDDAQPRPVETNLGSQQSLAARIAPPQTNLILFIEQVTDYCWLAWSRFLSWLERHSTPRELFTSVNELCRDVLNWFLEVFQSVGEYISNYVFVPLAAGFTFVFVGCEYCISNTVPALLQKSIISFAVILLATLVYKIISRTLQKKIPNVLGILYSVITYQPVLISILIALVLHGPVQLFLLDYFDTLKANPWWATFLFLFWWKAVKIIVHAYSYVFLTERNLYRPVLNPTFSLKDGLYSPSLFCSSNFSS